jgi:hypothetical protein
MHLEQKRERESESSVELLESLMAVVKIVRTSNRVPRQAL